MNINLRALVFGTAIAAVFTTTMNVVAAAEAPVVIRLDRVEVIAHRDAFDADGYLKAARLATVAASAPGSSTN